MKKTITAEEFDRLFDAGGDISEYLDLENAVMAEGKNEVKRVNVDMPGWMIAELDKEAKRMAIPRQAVIKRFIDDGLARMHAKKSY